MAKLIEFETERLRLRQRQPAERELFAALDSDPRVMEYFPSLLTRTERDAMTPHTLQEWADMIDALLPPSMKVFTTQALL